MHIQSKEVGAGATIELTPLIDMVFLLLIFFLVATTFHQTEREMQIALPYATSSEPISTLLKELIVNVDVEGRIIVGGRTLEVEQFEAMVTQAVTANPEQKVTVRGDRHAAYAHIVRVLDICKNAGIQEPFLDTVMND